MARAARRLLRHPARKRAHSHALSSAAASAQRLFLRTAYSVGARGAHDRPAGEAGADARPDVRPGRPSRADAADLESRYRRRRPADRARHHTKTVTSSIRRFFRAGLGCFADALREPCHRRPRMRAFATTSARPVHARAGPRAGSIALEVAIDEMADACGMDPFDFRLTNYAEVEPISGKPYSSKALARMLRQGRDGFGWSAPAARAAADARSNGLLVGWGMGTAVFPARCSRRRRGRCSAAMAAAHGDERDRYGTGRMDRVGTDRGRQPRA